MTRPKQHPETETLIEYLIATVKEAMSDDDRLNFNRVDTAFSLAWRDIEELFVEPEAAE